MFLIRNRKKELFLKWANEKFHLFYKQQGGKNKNNKDDNNKNKIANILMDKRSETQFGSV